jgi:VanZ family protein
VLYESTRSGGDPTLPELSTAVAYAGHFLGHALLVFCALMAIKRRRDLLAVPLVVATDGLFGIVLEAYQSTLSGREASAFDALANLLGAIAAAAAVTYLLPRWQHRRRES